MFKFYTRMGDEGFTGIIGKERLPKFDLQIEALGTVDEANAALGMARFLCKAPENVEYLLQVQRDLFALMSELAATPDLADKFRRIGPETVKWVEEKSDELSKIAASPMEFIVPGDSQAGAALDMARTIVRRAERRVVELTHRKGVKNPELVRFLNRLSSLVYIMELMENQAAGFEKSTLAKGKPV
jgi:cob(I)alamin adenosyltransferase